jgi:hypothetical protein
MPKRLSTMILIGLSGSAIILSAAECDPNAIRSATQNGRLVITNNSGKPVVAYVMADKTKTSTDGSSVRTYSGVFTQGDSLKPDSSMEIAKSGSPADVGVNYLRFADGSACGAQATEAGKTVAARFASGITK